MSVKENLQILQTLEELKTRNLITYCMNNKQAVLRCLEKIKNAPVAVKECLVNVMGKIGYYGSGRANSIPPLAIYACTREDVIDLLIWLEGKYSKEEYDLRSLYCSAEKILMYADFIPENTWNNFYLAVEKDLTGKEDTLPYLYYYLCNDEYGELAEKLYKKDYFQYLCLNKRPDGVYLSARYERYSSERNEIFISWIENLNGLYSVDIIPTDERIIEFIRRCNQEAFLQVMTEFSSDLSWRYNSKIIDRVLGLEDSKIEYLAPVLRKAVSFLEENGYDKLSFFLRFYEQDLDPEVIEDFLYRAKKADAEGIKTALSSEIGFVNFLTGNRYQALSKKMETEARGTAQENLMVYAIKNKKNAFLRLVEENFKLYLSLPENSILFQPKFKELCNLNTLGKKDLETLQKKEGDTYLYTGKNVDLFPLAVSGRQFTFRELKTLCLKNRQIQLIYVKMDVDSIDLRMIRILQLFHSSVNTSNLTDIECTRIAAALSVRSILEWKDEEHLDMDLPHVLTFLSLYETPVWEKLHTRIKDNLSIELVSRNAENETLLKDGLDAFLEHFLEYDADSIWLLKALDLTELEYDTYKESIKKFCIHGYASITREYYESTLEKQKKNVLLIAKASIFDKMDELKYTNFTNELAYQIGEKTLEAWKKNTRCQEGSMSAAEYTDFYHCMSIGELTGHTCMNYKDGMYNECLLSCFDGNKKVLYVKKDGEYVMRAILRLTKYSDTNPDKKKLGFIDVTEEEPNIQDKERMVLFLEKAYYQKLNDYQLQASRRLLIRLAKKKADEMGVELVLSEDYSSEASVDKKSGYMYVSRSKNGNQYLDSLGGSCESGGYYKSQNFYFYRMNQKETA